MPRIGVLALQGCVKLHQEKIQKLGASSILVKNKEDLFMVDGLILPGGESSTMIKICDLFGLWNPLYERGGQIPYWGVCAGSILMAKEVLNPNQKSLALMNVQATRNAYGRQIQSFESNAIVFQNKPTSGFFIRAPKLIALSKDVQSLATFESETVAWEEGMHMVSSFHPELTDSCEMHSYFLSKVKDSAL
ncbi:MAG: pyridoxal 5'-phosphate synthase glutaminase subunit PdxT [Oligoflexia bacterium]|nr:pyridoxal 5'-phosphate synthase glutaminase subunit PdxT [Oligoflexia bacterium]